MSSIKHEHDGKYIHPVFPFRYESSHLLSGQCVFLNVLFTRDFGVFKIGEQVERLHYLILEGKLTANGKEQGFAVLPR